MFELKLLTLPMLSVCFSLARASSSLPPPPPPAILAPGRHLKQGMLFKFIAHYGTSREVPGSSPSNHLLAL